MSKPTLLDMYRQVLAPLACPFDLNMETALTQCGSQKCADCWDRSVEARYEKTKKSKEHHENHSK